MVSSELVIATVIQCALNGALGLLLGLLGHEGIAYLRGRTRIQTKRRELETVTVNVSTAVAEAAPIENDRQAVLATPARATAKPA